MDWTEEDDMVDGLFCATLTGRRGGHTPFVQAGAEMSDTGAEAVEPDPGSSWEGHSGCVCTGVWNWSAESCGVVHPLRVPLMIHPLRRTYGSQQQQGPISTKDQKDHHPFQQEASIPMEGSGTTGSLAKILPVRLNFFAFSGNWVFVQASLQQFYMLVYLHWLFSNSVGPLLTLTQSFATVLAIFFIIYVVDYLVTLVTWIVRGRDNSCSLGICTSVTVTDIKFCHDNSPRIRG